ncbi:MAG: HAD-IIA family hydrolase [Acidimicrobiia bacterium]|nr:HAD-IIA family hydrolase [Acidimicrobiia bacterium]
MLDLDGVIWLDDHALSGAADAVAQLQSSGEVVFVTNNSRLEVGAQESKLARMGIDAAGAVITSAQSVVDLVESGQRVLVAAGPGVIEALTDADVEIVQRDHRGVDAVVIGIHDDFDYAELTEITRAVRAGARLLATNDDVSFPTPGGLVPGNGALVAAAEAATGVRATVAGKPHEPIAAMVRRRLGSTGVVVGDRPDTDGRFAETLGYDFALVMSGVTSPDDLPVTPSPRWVADDLAALVAAIPASAAWEPGSRPL